MGAKNPDDCPGYRESKESWAGVLRDLRDRGLSVAKLLVADGHLGIWAALAKVWPETLNSDAGITAFLNVLDKLPKRVQVEGRHLLTQIPYAPTRQEATKRRDQFAKRFRRECPDAVDILERDWDRMVTFYDFPEAHWQHLRTTNVVESPFASVRLRNQCGQTIQEGGQCHRPHLAGTDGGRETIPATQCTASHG